MLKLLTMKKTKKKIGCREGYEKILGKCYPKLKVSYAGTIEGYSKRDDLELINERGSVKTITKKCFENHPETIKFDGYLVNKRDACKESYGFHFPFPHPTKTVYKIVKGA